jgi:rod shape-determining protein MreC
VARVAKVLKRELGRDQEVEASPAVDFSRLDSALILLTVPDQTPETDATARGKKP